MSTRHSSTGHGRNCWCGKRATCHIAYGSGCDNVCDKHRRSVTKVKRSVTVTPVVVREAT
jgi:hypothetical protein